MQPLGFNIKQFPLRRGTVFTLMTIKLDYIIELKSRSGVGYERKWRKYVYFSRKEKRLGVSSPRIGKGSTSAFFINSQPEWVQSASSIGLQGVSFSQPSPRVFVRLTNLTNFGIFCL